MRSNRSIGSRTISRSSLCVRRNLFLPTDSSKRAP